MVFFFFPALMSGVLCAAICIFMTAVTDQTGLMAQPSGVEFFLPSWVERGLVVLMV
jgi:hypothetical protein